MVKAKTRARKGAVAIHNRDGMVRLRWSYANKNYSLALGLPWTPANKYIADGKAKEIEADIRLDRFDPTLAKYKPQLLERSNTEKLSTLKMWLLWMDARKADGVSAQTLCNRYQTIANHLNRFKRDITSEAEAEKLFAELRTRQSPKTVNRNLKMLTAFADWAIKQGWLDSNPFVNIKLLKESSYNQRSPFTHQECQQILQTFRTHKNYWQYYDFVYALMCLGLRPSEAIGLRYRHIDWRSRTITVCESLSRGSDGKSAGYAREQRQRKTGNSTVLDLPDDLYALFQGRFTSACKPEDLIFTSATGKAIDDHNFSQRVWKTVLKEAGIDYRPPYNLRHSMASHAIAQGATLPEVAYLLGHKNTRMVSEVYGHTINRPQVPKLEL